MRLHFRGGFQEIKCFVKALKFCYFVELCRNDIILQFYRIIIGYFAQRNNVEIYIYLVG